MADLFDKVNTRKIALERAKKHNSYISYAIGDKIIREYPNTGEKVEVTEWTEELENKLQNVKTTLEVEGFQLTDRELDMVRKKITGEITDEEYQKWCKGLLRA